MINNPVCMFEEITTPEGNNFSDTTMKMLLGKDYNNPNEIVHRNEAMWVNNGMRIKTTYDIEKYLQTFKK